MPTKSYILGTDWWTDCDDAVAIRILARAHRENKINLKAVGINACMEHSVPSLDAFLAFDGVTDVPLGIDPEAGDFAGTPKFQIPLAPFAKRYKSNTDAENAVKLYRRILAESTEKVEIIEIGFLNVAADLLLSRADEISDKNGVELVREKVSKFWVMAGKWDEDGGLEHNFCNNDRARKAGETFLKLCPVPATFLGFEVGDSVISGGKAVLPKGDALMNLMETHGSENGRSSWDPMTVLLALTGDEEKAGYDAVTGTATLDVKDGANHFTPCENGMHKYVIKAEPDTFYADAINKLIK
ncbi:MAG: hypothetical protein IKU43_03860 [Clostridia bacterium]|nr:hypothetical protein [Clostridia bacterium]